MNRYNQYHIKDSDRFDPYIFSKVRDELEQIFKATAVLPLNNKEYIIISFLKTHSLKNEWIQDNPQLTSLFTNGNFSTSNIDSLYESGKNNSLFIQSFEDYIRNNIS